MVPESQPVIALTHDPETVEDVAPALSEIREQAEGMAAARRAGATYSNWAAWQNRCTLATSMRSTVTTNGCF